MDDDDTLLARYESGGTSAGDVAADDDDALLTRYESASGASAQPSAQLDAAPAIHAQAASAPPRLPRSPNLADTSLSVPSLDLVMQKTKAKLGVVPPPESFLPPASPNAQFAHNMGQVGMGALAGGLEATIGDPGRQVAEAIRDPAHGLPRLGAMGAMMASAPGRIAAGGLGLASQPGPRSYEQVGRSFAGGAASLGMAASGGLEMAQPPGPQAQTPAAAAIAQMRQQAVARGEIPGPAVDNYPQTRGVMPAPELPASGPEPFGDADYHGLLRQAEQGLAQRRASTPLTASIDDIPTPGSTPDPLLPPDRGGMVRPEFVKGPAALRLTQEELPTGELRPSVDDSPRPPARQGWPSALEADQASVYRANPRIVDQAMAQPSGFAGESGSPAPLRSMVDSAAGLRLPVEPGDIVPEISRPPRKAPDRGLTMETGGTHVDRNGAIYQHEPQRAMIPADAEVPAGSPAERGEWRTREIIRRVMGDDERGMTPADKAMAARVITGKASAPEVEQFNSRPDLQRVAGRLRQLNQEAANDPRLDITGNKDPHKHVSKAQFGEHTTDAAVDAMRKFAADDPNGTKPTPYHQVSSRGLTQGEPDIGSGVRAQAAAIGHALDVKPSLKKAAGGTGNLAYRVGKGVVSHVVNMHVPGRIGMSLISGLEGKGHGSKGAPR